MSVFFSVFLFCVDRDLAMGRSPVQGIVLKYLKGFILSDVNSESEQTRAPNLWNVKVK
jgi:hypothetical protein